MGRQICQYHYNRYYRDCHSHTTKHYVDISLTISMTYVELELYSIDVYNIIPIYYTVNPTRYHSVHYCPPQTLRVSSLSNFTPHITPLHISGRFFPSIIFIHFYEFVFLYT